MSSFVPHLVSGLAVGTVATTASYFINYPVDSSLYYLLPFVAGVSGALTPDMDIKSKSSQCMYILYTGLAIYLYYIDRIDLAFLTLLYSIIPQFFGHRGFIHSNGYGILSTAILFWIAYHNTNNEMLSIFICTSYYFGFLIHSILDHK